MSVCSQPHRFGNSRAISDHTVLPAYDQLIFHPTEGRRQSGLAWVEPVCMLRVCAGYAETSVDQLTSALYTGLAAYDQLPNLVLFKDAVHHVARLSRVLVGSSDVSVSTAGLVIICLQCFYAVGWAAGRASGL